MPVGSAAIHIVTGIPFTVTFNNATNTFSINASGDYTGMFIPNQILTAIGGSPNGGYQLVTSSTYTGGHTVVTVSSYSTGTAYPGPAEFTTGTGTIIWFNATGGGPPPPIGLVWTSSVSPTVNPISAMATLSGTTLIVDNDSGNVYKSTNGGISWSTVATGIPNTGIFAQGALAVGGSTWIYSVDAQHVDRSTDNGATWTSYATGITSSAGASTIATNGSGTWVVSNNVAGGWLIPATADVPIPPTVPGFIVGETITQAVTGATAMFIGVDNRSFAVVDGTTITGTPDATDIWTGNTSTATFTPTAIPAADYTDPLAYSTNDGISWTPTDPFDGGCLAAIPFIWDGSKFVTSMDNATGNSYLVTSTDGISWTKTTPTNSSHLFEVNYANGNYMVIDDAAFPGSEVFSSTVAGLATNSETPVNSLSILSTLTGGSGKYFVFDNIGGVANSTDGTTWATGTLNLDQEVIQGGVPILYALTGGVNGNFIAVGQSGVTYTSTDGASWTYHTSGQSNTLYSVTTGFSNDIAVGTAGTMLYSSDDMTWTANNQGSNDLYGVAYIDPVFFSVLLTVGASGTIFASGSPPTGAWTPQTSGTGVNLYGVAGQPGFTYIVGAAGTILQSTDSPGVSMTWSPMTSNTSNDLYSIAGNQNGSVPVAVAVGAFGTVCTSTDNATWSSQTISGLSTFPLNFVTYDYTNNLFVTGGSQTNGVYTSPPGLTVTGTNGNTGTFTAGDTITQGSSGATAQVAVTNANATPFIITNIVGTPDAVGVWTDTFTPGATFTPSSIPAFTWTYQSASNNNMTVNGGYNQSPNVIGTDTCITVGISTNQATATQTINTTTNDVTWTPHTQGPTFIPGETVTQAVSGATATFIASPAANGAWLVINSNTITGTPDGNDLWVGNISGTVMAPGSTPNPDFAYVAVYDSTNNSFIAGGYQGSISTYAL